MGCPMEHELWPTVFEKVLRDFVDKLTDKPCHTLCWTSLTLEGFLRKKNHQQKKSSKIMGCLQNWMNGFWIVNTGGIENNCWKTGLDHIFTHLWCQEEEFVFQSKGKRKLLKGDDLFKATFRMEQRKKDLLGTRHSARHSTARSLSLF